MTHRERAEHAIESALHIVDPDIREKLTKAIAMGLHDVEQLTHLGALNEKRTGKVVAVVETDNLPYKGCDMCDSETGPIYVSARFEGSHSMLFGRRVCGDCVSNAEEAAEYHVKANLDAERARDPGWYPR